MTDPVRTSRILMVGPPPTHMGGMASVVEQMLSLNYDGLYRPILFATTHAGTTAETLFARVRRHVRHLRKLTDAIRAEQPAVVHIHTCSGFSFFRSLADMRTCHRQGCPVALHIHGASFDEFYTAAATIKKKLIAAGLARADRVIALSETWRQTLERIQPHARIRVVENAVSLPQSTDRTKRIDPCHFLILARMDVWKGVDDLLSACMNLSRDGVSFKVTLAGPEGSAGDREALQRKIHNAQLGEFVQYVGEVRGERKDALLRSADVYVQPSHHEGMPIAVLEAMSYELPIVATRVGAIPEIVQHEATGLLVPSHSPNELANAMRRLMENTQERMRFGHAVRRLVQERFSLARFKRDLVGLYNELAKPVPRVLKTRTKKIDEHSDQRQPSPAQSAS